MSDIEVKDRIEKLEAEVKALRNKFKKIEESRSPWYKNIPDFSGNPAYEEASRLASEKRKDR